MQRISAKINSKRYLNKCEKSISSNLLVCICERVENRLNFIQMAAPVDVSGEFSTLFNFEKSKRRRHLLIAFSKTVY